MKAYFFDLDGTLTDSREGILGSLRASLAAIGTAPPSDGQLAVFLGTPLPDIYRALRPDIDEDETARAIQAYRSHYDAEGIKLNRAYPGVVEMLERLNSNGLQAWVVTSKPQVYAELVVEDMGFAGLLTGVVGAGLDEKDTKADLVRRALAAAQVSADEAIMLGDRRYDVEGALANGVHSAGATWGYGSPDELRAAGCLYLVRSISEFCEQFIEPVRLPAAQT